MPGCRRTFSIFSFAPCLALAIGLAGCSSPGTTGTSNSSNPAALAPSGASTVFVLAGSQVLGFGLTGTGAPATTLTLPSGFLADSIAVDKNSSTLYVAALVGSPLALEVLAYPVTATGSVAPTRAISGDAGSLVFPSAMTVDASGLLYIAGGNGIVVYAANATGTATPVQFINGPVTQLPGTQVASSTTGIAVDTADNIYTSNIIQATLPSPVKTSSILVFPKGSTGNVAPVRVLTSSQPQDFLGVSTDGNQNFYALERLTISSSGASILKFSTGASGSATPSATVSGPAVDNLWSLVSDSLGNLYSWSPTSAGFQILGYGPGTSGTVTAPGLTLKLTGVSTFSQQIAVD